MPSIATLLAQAQPGSDQTSAALLPLVYKELRALASGYLSRDGKHTLQPTALVHEAFIKMLGNDRQWAGRDHFMAVAATAMRQVLVDHARTKNTQKRGGGIKRADVSMEGLGAAENAPMELRVLELEDLLVALAKASPRAARVAEMRLFGGMTPDQIARVMSLSDMSVKREWQLARAWLAGKIQERSDG